ncbi:MmcQ/YjbR family DNA-binding protein [Quadrisphaera granulorum]|uniref:MmcQ/YjbR family DNA-binding protein n=1 Tax=Quadrisphaera granulorum TaxID=317664 RepID=UPI000D6CAAD9|nr:MmcQ/YjbR family DNA-binding protein [Quadrisphaera granulorum]
MADEDDVRRLALALPDTTEKPSWGTPGFRVHDKLFARLHDEPGILALRRPSIEDAEELAVADPVAFFRTSHYTGYPYVLARLAELEVDELAEVLREAWEVQAPRSLREQHR